MAINYVTTYGPQFDRALVQGLLTAPLEATNVEWARRGRSFTLRGVTTSGYQQHGRNKGFNYGTVDTADVTYTPKMDRDIEFYVDTMDVLETDGLLATAEISAVFNETQAQPEVDAYRFSKMSEISEAAGNLTTEAVTPANVLAITNRMTGAVRRYGPENVMVFVSGAFMDALAASPDFTRVINVGTIPGGTINTRISSFNGFTLIEVWDDARFMTEFDFTDGFKPMTGASQAINAIAVATNSVFAVVKHRAIFTFGPGEHSQGDGYLYQNRIYHDLFERPMRPNGVIVSAAPVA